MSEPIITRNWIDRYLANELDAAERAVFEKRLQTDPRLQAELEIGRVLERFLLDRDLQDFLRKTQQAREGRPRGFSGRNFLLLAASLALLAGACGVLSRIAGKDPPSPVRHSDADLCEVKVPVRLRHEPDQATAAFWPATRAAQRFRPSENQPEDPEEVGADTPELTSPPLNTLWPNGEAVCFAWNRKAGQAPRTLTVSDHMGRPIRILEGCDGTACTVPTQGLSDGFYTWRICDGSRVLLRGELLLVGRIKG